MGVAGLTAQRDRREYATTVDIEYHRAPGVHVIHVEATSRRIETLIVKAICRAREWKLPNELKAGLRSLLRCD